MFFVCAAFFLPCALAQAWDGAGYMAIAAITYSELSPRLKQEASEILRSHPDCGRWEASFERSEQAGYGLADEIRQAQMRSIRNWGQSVESPVICRRHYTLERILR